ncbi:MAG: CHAT domain-containing protein [Synergistaceae bacterium]|jgi:CHAT domain-containing protein/tetratricopeptide (TPR) repeat protein|nr:CHAT domain-containing protein [Synergistaceae bacterium]
MGKIKKIKIWKAAILSIATLLAWNVFGCLAYLAYFPDAAHAASKGDGFFNEALAAYQAQKMEDAAKSFGLAGEVYEKEKNKLKAAQCYYNQGLCQNASAQSEPAIQAFDKASGLYQSVKDVGGECNARLSAAQLYMNAMEWDKARERYERTAKIAAKTPLMRGLAEEGLGRVQRAKGDLEEAEKFFKSAEKSYKNNPGGGLRVRLQLAFIAGMRGDVLEGLEMYDAVAKDAAALQKNEKTRDEGNRLTFLAQSEKGYLLLTTGWFAEAQKTFSEALAAGEKLGMPDHAPELLSVKNNYAQTSMYLGDFAQAEKEMSELLNTAVGTNNTTLKMELNSELGVLARMKGQYEPALKFFQIFRSLASEFGQQQRLAQAYIQLANLYGEIGMWNESAAHYQEAFSASLKAQDMDSALIAMQGVYAGDIRNELGLVGKVDYKSMQGLPWRASLTARPLRKEKGYDDQGLKLAWMTVDSLRKEIFAPVPSLDGFRLIREMAFRAAPKIRHYYQEVKVAWDIGDAALRLATKRLRSAEKAEEALRELAARKNEAVDARYVERAFGTTLNFLRVLAGEGTLSAPSEETFTRIQAGGISLEPTEPEPPQKNATPQAEAVDADIKKLESLYKKMSPLKAGETESLQKALIAGQPLPESLKNKLRSALFSQASQTPSPTDAALRQPLLSLLETFHSGSDKSSSKRTAKQKRQDEQEAEKLLPSFKNSPYFLLSFGAGEEMLGYLESWRNMRRRAVILRELGITLKTDKNWGNFLKQLGAALGKGKERFDVSFALTLDNPEATTKPQDLTKMRDLARELALMELRDESDNIQSLLTAEGKISHSDRLSLLELQSRIYYALSEPEKAEKTAKKSLDLITAPLDALDSEMQPDMQWRAYALLARIAEDKKDWGGAAGLYEKALTQAAKVHPIEGTTSQSASDRAALYSGAIRVAFELWREKPSAENAEKVWLALEGMKGRQWRELMATMGGEFLNSLPSDVQGKIRALEARRVALEGEYNRASGARQSERMTQINDEMRRLREERVKLTQNLSLEVKEIPGTAAVRSLMPADWGVADYYLSPSLSFAILLKKEEEPRVIPLDVDYDSLFGYSYWMRSKQSKLSPYEEYDENKFPDRGDLYVTVCGLSPQDVGDGLFQPVAAECGKLKKLLVIPHDILYVLPFEAMRQSRDDKASYLVEDWTFAELPSAFLLTRGEKAEPGLDKSRKENSLLLVANPAYGELFTKKGADWLEVVKQDPDVESLFQKHIDGTSLKQFLSAGPRGEEFQQILDEVWEENLAGTRKFMELDSTVKKDFAPKITLLAGTQTEADSLRDLWREKGNHTPKMLLAGHASEEAFWESDPGQYRYIHIACHGYDRGTIPDLQPGLALSPILDFKNDSFLQMGELSTVKWNAELVVLSACETGLGDLYVGDGMFGLSTVLLAGGAKGAVLTRWRAFDDTAPRFMERLYSTLLDDVLPVDALHEAQLSMLKRAPRHWAVFKYVGIPW